MKFVLGSLPALLIIFGFLMLRFNGRKELLKMDLVQFLYAFVLTPALFIWVKTFVFYNLKDELGVQLDVEDMYLIDTIITVIFFYIYSFMVIHSLTKTFQIKRMRDPLYDIFTHSEYFHGWLSHLVLYSCGLLGVLFFGVLNLFFPIIAISTKAAPYIGAVTGVLISIVFYFAVWSFKTENKRKFNRIMKFQIVVYAIFILISYILIRPKFVPAYTIFWGSVFFYIALAVFSRIIKRSLRFQRVLLKFDTTV